MATKKKPTSKKTKTSGAKKAVNTTRKATVTRVSAAAKKQEVAVDQKTTTSREQVTAKKVSKPVSMFKKLNDRNWMFGLVYAASAVAVVIAGNDAYRAVTTTFVTTDPLRSGQAPTYVQAVRVLFDINLLYLVAAVLGVAAITHLLVASVFRSRYEGDLNRQTNRSRWIGHGIGDGLAVAGVGLLAGISDITTLVTLMILVLVSTVAVITAHGHIGSSHKTGRMVFLTGMILMFAPWLIIGSYLFSAYKYGSGVPIDYMWWTAGAVFATYVAYMLVERMRHKEKQFVSDYANVEWLYMLIGFALKAAFAGIVFTQLLR